MSRPPLALLAALSLFAGCMDPVPYRLSSLNEDPSCAQYYAAYDVNTEGATSLAKVRLDNPCWRRGMEEHPTYDLLFVEFTDQGWIQASSDLDRPSRDYLDVLMDKLHSIHGKWRTDQPTAEYHGLPLVVFLHGWHHNARADDSHVLSFRAFLSQMASLESTIAPATLKPRRVIGLYIGWRGESVRMPWLKELTFWERKKTAERVSLGTIRELLNRLDHFRDRSRDPQGRRDVRMLTIGHSFGGLMTYAATGAEFVRNAVRFKDRKQGTEFDKFMSRVGDLVVIVNPAFEGARHEPLHTAGQRLCGVEPNQLPVLVVATSAADAATGFLFPLARRITTTFEKTTGHEEAAIVKAVGHNDRYTTHELTLCNDDDPRCKAARSCGIDMRGPEGIQASNTIAQELRDVARFSQNGFAHSEYLCGGLELRSTTQWFTKDNPFWVVRTSNDIIRDHSDVFNPRFVTFFRQLYLALIYARTFASQDSSERNPCRRSG